MRGVPLCFCFLPALRCIGVGRDLQPVAEPILLRKRILLRLGGHYLDLDVMSAISLVMAVVPDADIAGCEWAVHRYFQPGLHSCPICVIDFLCGSSLEVLGRAEDDVQILECSAVTPVIPEVDLADRIFVAKVDLRIGRVARVLRLVLADLDIFCVIFDAICQPAVRTVTSAPPFIYNCITTRRDIM